MFRSLHSVFSGSILGIGSRRTRAKTSRATPAKRRFQPALEHLEAREQPAVSLVMDINPGLPSSSPTELVNRNRPGIDNDLLFFAADDGFRGRELWVKRPGTPPELVRDINPGPDSSGPQNLTIVHGILYFSADDGLTGRELWRSDGTRAGTFMVRDINPGPEGSDPAELIRFSRQRGRRALLYFSADDGLNGRELWRSAGSRNNTRMVRDINPGPEDSTPTYLTVGPIRSGGIRTLLFRADDGTLGAELWRSSGTFASTVLVKDIRPGLESSNPFNLTRVAGKVFFGADDGFRGAELWRTNGNFAGTDIVRDINPGPGSSMIESDISLMANYQGQLFFAADDGFFGRELWRSNGSFGGTVLVRDINPGAGSSNPTMQAHPLQNRRYLILNQVLFFGADDGFFGGELWSTNGTTGGTTLVKDINPGAAGSLVDNQLIGVVFRHRTRENRIYFAANDGDTIHDNELWRTNGTNPGTVLDADINVGPDPSNPASFEIAAGDLFFAANDGFFGRELWRRDLP